MTKPNAIAFQASQKIGRCAQRAVGGEARTPNRFEVTPPVHRRLDIAGQAAGLEIITIGTARSFNSRVGWSRQPVIDL